MDDIWKALRSIHVTTDPEASRRRTDRSYAKDLQISQTEDRWQTFYRAIDALERGCGYQPFPELEALCQKASAGDAQQFLRVVEEKSFLFDIVTILRDTDNEILLRWIEEEMIQNVNVLLECLRKSLQKRHLSEREQHIAAKGLLLLCTLSPDRFQYILQNSVLYRQDCVLTMREIIPQLPETGWSALSACVDFAQPEGSRFRFWSECALYQGHLSVGRQGEPLLQAWYCFLEQRVQEGSAWSSLCNEVSNLLIGILLGRFDTPAAYEQTLEQIIARTEAAMYRWYERSLQQSAALLSGLSLLEHMRYVWLNLEGSGSPPSGVLCRRALQLISQRRYLWDSSSNGRIGEEVKEMTSWLQGCRIEHQA